MDINELVVSSLKSNHGVVCPIWTVENAAKYAASSADLLDRHRQVSEEMLSLMTSLNQEGVSRADLCAAPCGKGALNEGFQEGNELPDTIGQIIRRVGGARTYILSEMQLSSPDGDQHIHRFYEHGGMSRFSDLVGLKLGFEKTGDHEVVISEIEHDDDRYRVAVTLLPVNSGHDEGYLLTNVCLKYTREQFIRVRQNYGGCRVIGEYCSGDGSVLYQLAEYCAHDRVAN